VKRDASKAWDVMCMLASRNNYPTTAVLYSMRTADPRINPRAVACCETSTSFRKSHERLTDATAY
jgi:hypothetical protein